MSFMDSEFPTGYALRDVRYPRIVRAVVRASDGQDQDVVIRNISQRGLGATCKGAPPVRGERVTVVLPGGTPLSGQVRWFSGHSFGMQLDEDFDIETLAQALQRQAHVSRVKGEWHVETRHRVATPQVDPTRFRRI